MWMNGHRHGQWLDCLCLLTTFLILTVSCVGADLTDDQSNFGGRLVSLKRPTVRKQQLLTSSFIIHKTPDDVAVQQQVKKEIEKAKAVVLTTDYLPPPPLQEQSEPISFSPGLVFDEPNLEYLPPLPPQSPPAPPSPPPIPEKKSSVYFPPPARNPTIKTVSNLSLFDTALLANDVPTGSSLSLFDDNVIPPAGVVERIVVNNGKNQVQQKYYTIPSRQPLNDQQEEYDRQDGSLFDLESTYVDNQAANSPSFERITTKKPRTPSLFDVSNQDDDYKIPIATSLANFEPSPPAAVFIDVAPPAAPPAAPPSTFVQGDGDYNQLSLTWAQLHASLTPSTDAGSIISSITSSGSHNNGGTRPAPPVGPPRPPIGPPAPPVGPPSPVGPPAPPISIRPPSPPTGPQPPAPPFNLPGLSLFGSRPANTFNGPRDNDFFVQAAPGEQQQLQQQQSTPGGPTIIIYSGGNPGQQQQQQQQQQQNDPSYGRQPSFNPPANPPSSYESFFVAPANPPSNNYGSFNQPAFNPPASASFNHYAPASQQFSSPPSSPSFNNYAPASQQFQNPPSAPSFNSYSPATQQFQNPPSAPSLNSYSPATQQFQNPPSAPSFNSYAPVTQQFQNPPSAPSFNNYGSSNQPILSPPQSPAAPPQPPAPPPQPPAPPPQPPAPIQTTYYNHPSSPPASPAFNSYGEPIGLSGQPIRQPQQQQQQQLPSYVLPPASPPASAPSSYTPSSPPALTFQDPVPVSNPSYQLSVLSPPQVSYVQVQQQQPQQQQIFVQQQQQPIVVQQQPRPVVVQQQPVLVQQQQPVLVQQQQQPVIVQQQPVVLQQAARPLFVQQQTRPIVVQQARPLLVQQQRPVVVQQQQQPVFVQQQQAQFSDDSYGQTYQQPAYQQSYEPSYQSSYEPVYQQVAQPVIQPVVTTVLQPVRQVFDPVFRPAGQQVFRVPFKNAQKANKAKAKGKEGKGKDKFKSKGKGPSNSYGAPSNTYGPPAYNPPATQPQQDQPQNDPLLDTVEVLQPQLDIQYQYRYSGPPIMSRGEKASKKLKKLFYKGAILLSGLGAITAVPIVPGVIGRKKRDTRPPGELQISLALPPSTELIQDSYATNLNSSVDASLFDTLPFQGAPIPKKLRQELARYLPPAEAINDAECLQKSFCENLIELNDSPFQDSFLFFYSALSPEADTNPWLQQSLTAARKKKCGEFYCTKKTEDIYEEEQDDEYAAGDQIDDSLASVDTVSRNLEAENVSQQPTS